MASGTPKLADNFSKIKKGGLAIRINFYLSSPKTYLLGKKYLQIFKIIYNESINAKGQKQMDIKIDVCPSVAEEGIHIKTPDIQKAQAIKDILLSTVFTKDMDFFIGDTQYFVGVNKILFFETNDGKITAHTSKNMYYSRSTLQELEKSLPPCFVRASKCCIINAMAVSSITKNLTGPSKVCFKNTEKSVYVSKNYYKDLKDKIYALRIK